jgi:glutathione synthase/RimK-type ligase-like ATP-grasp enzyme
LLLLDLIGSSDPITARQRTEIVNPPKLLFTSSEKLEASFLPELMPRSLVASEWSNLLSFGLAEKRTVLKPLDNAQSRDVHLIRWDSQSEIERAHEIVRLSTSGFRCPVMLQQYLDVIGQGETRLWFLDSDLLASARKVSRSGDFCLNMDKGDSLVCGELSNREQAAADLISSHLRRRKIRLAAVDLIEGQVTDFNFTSPGLLCEFERIRSQNLARIIVERLAQPSSDVA